ncbi:hypothetical protein MP638_003568 [Amoeboaphelidium occidentale]|nr:hypothetical protein MP638_003568 [Amoeboaphelidium occidentale]
MEIAETQKHDDKTQHDKVVPLHETVTKWIRFNGAISVAEFMQLALTHPKHGYYMRDADVIGKKGDFITSPEISQIFGEMVALWAVNHYKDAPKRNLSLAELGPGIGTLLSDMLRTFKKFPKFFETLSEIILVEPSRPMRKKQLNAIGKLFDIQEQQHDDRALLANGMEIKWFDSLNVAQKQDDRSYVVIAHELFDALPIHQIQRTKDGLREVLVDIDDNSNDGFRFVLSQKETPVITAMSNYYDLRDIPEGETMEFSPAACSILDDICHFVGDNDGLALVMDYGREGYVPPSLRGIRKHEFVHPLKHVGETDLSADVDFELLTRHTRKHFPSLNPSKMITQSQFLKRMGIDVRLAKLLEATKDPKEADKLVSSYTRLVGERKKDMGSIYKFWSLSNKQDNFPFY